MKHRENLIRPEMIDERGARVQRGHHQVEQVRRMLTIGRCNRELHLTFTSPHAEFLSVTSPDRLAPSLNLVTRLELRQQIGGEDARTAGSSSRRPPSVYLIDLAAEEPAAVGALLAEDLGPLDEARVVDQQRAALAAGDVLGLVEAERRERRRASRAAGLCSVRTARARCLRRPRRPCRAAMSMIASISQATPA